MKYAYYPGCSAHSTARDMHESTMAVSRALGLDLVEIEGWTCCGATAAHQTDRVLAVSLPAANLLRAGDMGLDMVVNCAACFNRMKTANHAVAANGALRERVAGALGCDYDGSVQVHHLLEILLKDVGVGRIRDLANHPLNGLKVACYYGCLLVRPPEVTQFDDPENPTSLDRLVEAVGGVALDWPHKIECCGGGLSLARTDVVVGLSDVIVGMAREAGADCIAVSCPMCQVNLDLRQQDIARELGRRHDMPVLYITQLLGLSFGLSPGELGMGRLMVSPGKIIEMARYTL